MVGGLFCGSSLGRHVRVTGKPCLSHTKYLSGISSSVESAYNNSLGSWWERPPLEDLRGGHKERFIGSNSIFLTPILMLSEVTRQHHKLEWVFIDAVSGHRLALLSWTL